jgi:hypothetical protein
MTIEWLKLFHHLPEDRKLLSFSVSQKWAWVCLLCAASQGEKRGCVVDDQEDMAVYCGFSNIQDYQFFLDKLRQKGMIEPITGGFKILNWEKRQYVKPSDSAESTRERKRKQRAKSSESAKPVSRDVTPMSRPCHATDTDPDLDPDLDPEVEEYYAHEGTAIADHFGGEWPVSSPSLSFPEKENSQHPEQPKETIDTAETPQGNDGSCGHIDSLDKPRAGGGNTRNLVYGGNIHKIMTLVGIGQSSGLWTSQEGLAAFQAALMRELDRLGRREPARALTAILKGVERRSTPEIEEVRKYWARFDGKEITPIPVAPLPWVGVDGRLDAGYVAWVRANASALDGELPDGTYKVDLILQTRSSNKLAVAAWESYQKELRYQSWIDAEALRKQREWDDRTALLETERAAKLARTDYATAC